MDRRVNQNYFGKELCADLFVWYPTFMNRIWITIQVVLHPVDMLNWIYYAVKKTCCKATLCYTVHERNCIWPLDPSNLYKVHDLSSSEFWFLNHQSACSVSWNHTRTITSNARGHRKCNTPCYRLIFFQHEIQKHMYNTSSHWRRMS